MSATSTAPQPVKHERLKARRDFLAAARARKAVTDSLLLQDKARRDGDRTIRVGFTASKKVGNAVTRNRAKRRMRALAHEILPDLAEPGHDYVLIARKDATVLNSFDILRGDLRKAFARVQNR